MITDDTKITPEDALNELIRQTKELKTNNPLGNALKEMLKTSRPTIASRQIRNLMPQIEELKGMGYSDQTITELLNKSGVAITKSSFKNAIFRIRKERLER